MRHRDDPDPCTDSGIRHLLVVWEVSSHVNLFRDHLSLRVTYRLQGRNSTVWSWRWLSVTPLTRRDSAWLRAAWKCAGGEKGAEHKALPTSILGNRWNRNPSWAWMDSGASYSVQANTSITIAQDPKERRGMKRQCFSVFQWLQGMGAGQVMTKKLREIYP